MRGKATYRHINTLDIDLLVHKIRYVGLSYVKVKGTLFNRRNGIVYETKTYKINIVDLPNWKRVAG